MSEEKRIVLTCQHSVWPSGVEFKKEHGMWKEFKDAIHGVSESVMDTLVQTGRAKILEP